MHGTETLESLVAGAIEMLGSFGAGVDGMTSRRRVSTATSFLALAGMRRGKRWSEVADVSTRAVKTRDMIKHMNRHLGENRSPGSYDDVRRKDLRPLAQAGIVVESMPASSPNNPMRGYGISVDHGRVARSYGTGRWARDLKELVARRGPPGGAPADRPVKKIPVDIPGKERVLMSLGGHSELHGLVIDELLPRFCQGSEVLYIGDARSRILLREDEKLAALGFSVGRGLLPDVIAHSERRGVLYLIEAVYSSNPFTAARRLEMCNLGRNCGAGLAFVSAFRNRRDFRRFAAEIAWGTAAWIADEPDHVIHFDGGGAIGPHQARSAARRAAPGGRAGGGAADGARPAGLRARAGP